jgi:hypothetical protein
MENAIKQVSKNTVMLEHVLPHDTIGGLTKRAHLEGTRFRVFITAERMESAESQISGSVGRISSLIRRLENNNISQETLEVLEKGVKNFRENFVMRDLFSDFAEEKT